MTSVLRLQRSVARSPLSLGLGMRAESTRAGRDWLIEVLIHCGVHWIRVDDAGHAETALRVGPVSADVGDEPARQVRSKKIPVFFDDGTRSAHLMAHTSLHAVGATLVSKVLRWRTITAAETGAIRRFQRCSSTTYMFSETTAGQHSTDALWLPSCTLLTLRSSCASSGRTEGVIEHVIATIVSLLDELGCQRTLLKRPAGLSMLSPAQQH